MLFVQQNIGGPIYIGDITATVEELVVLEENNVIMIVNADITLPEGGKLIVNNCDTIGSRAMLKNVTVNGVLITAENAADYIVDVEIIQVDND